MASMPNLNQIISKDRVAIHERPKTTVYTYGDMHTGLHKWHALRTFVLIKLRCSGSEPLDAQAKYLTHEKAALGSTQRMGAKVADANIRLMRLLEQWVTNEWCNEVSHIKPSFSLRKLPCLFNSAPHMGHSEAREAVLRGHGCRLACESDSDSPAQRYLARSRFVIMRVMHIYVAHAYSVAHSDIQASEYVYARRAVVGVVWRRLQFLPGNNFLGLAVFKIFCMVVGVTLVREFDLESSRAAASRATRSDMWLYNVWTEVWTDFEVLPD